MYLSAINARGETSARLVYHAYCELTSRGICVGQARNWRRYIHKIRDLNVSKIAIPTAETLIQEAITLSGDPKLGVSVGFRQSFASMGLLGAGMLACNTYAEALRLFLKHQNLVMSMADCTLSTDPDRPDEIYLDVRPQRQDSPIADFLIQAKLANLWSMSKFMCGTLSPVAHLSFTASEGEAGTIGKPRDCQINFDASDNRATLIASRMDTPIPSHDPFALMQLKPVLADLDKTLMEQCFLKRVDEVCQTLLPHGATLNSVARALGMSDRSLRRRLESHDVKFGDLLDDLRKRRATALLLQTDLSLEQISQTIGFEDVRSLRRRMMEWTGLSPRDYRRQAGISAS